MKKGESKTKTFLNNFIKSNVIFYKKNTKNLLEFLICFSFISYLLLISINTHKVIIAFFSFFSFLGIILFYFSFTSIKIFHKTFLYIPLFCLSVLSICMCFHFYTASSEINGKQYYETAMGLVYTQDAQQYQYVKNKMNDHYISMSEYAEIKTKIDSPKSYCCKMGCVITNNNRKKILCDYINQNNITEKKGKLMLLMVLKKGVDKK